MSRVGVVALCTLISGCAVRHIAKYEPKHRVYENPASTSAASVAQGSGSLYNGNASPAMLFTDSRALRSNDLVVVKVEELADSQRNADTDLHHSSKLTADVAAFLQVAGIKTQDIGLEASGSLGTDFSGNGRTRRTERLVATVPALVRQVLPNGNLFVEGHRVVLVNQEEHHFYISGVVRPIDIDQQNSIKSSLLADAEVEFTASGNLSDNERQGWLSRFFSWVSPF